MSKVPNKVKGKVKDLQKTERESYPENDKDLERVIHTLYMHIIYLYI